MWNVGITGIGKERERGKLRRQKVVYFNLNKIQTTPSANQNKTKQTRGKKRYDAILVNNNNNKNNNNNRNDDNNNNKNNNNKNPNQNKTEMKRNEKGRLRPSPKNDLKKLRLKFWIDEESLENEGRIFSLLFQQQQQPLIPSDYFRSWVKIKVSSNAIVYPTNTSEIFAEYSPLGDRNDYPTAKGTS